MENFYKPMDVIEFLRESNNIEDVWDDDSLVQAYKAWEHAIKFDRITPQMICEVHAILMKNQDLEPDEKGAFRKVPVYIGNREGRPWFAIPELIANWCDRLRYSEEVQRDHVDYEKIHPFVDGNGRTGRIFMNWQRMKHQMPILIIKNDEKQAYYDWFND